MGACSSTLDSVPMCSCSTWRRTAHSRFRLGVVGIIRQLRCGWRKDNPLYMVFLPVFIFPTQQRFLQRTRPEQHVLGRLFRKPRAAVLLNATKRVYDKFNDAEWEYEIDGNGECAAFRSPRSFRASPITRFL